MLVLPERYLKLPGSFGISSTVMNVKERRYLV
jgi:hypothetical protein